MNDASVNISKDKIEQLIRQCQAETETAIREGNPPFSCLITDLEGNVVTQSHNTQNTDSDPTAHAEINALKTLGKKIGSKYLDKYVVFTNAEPCSMCASACIKSHIYDFYYGAPAEENMDPWLPIRDIAKSSKTPLNIVGPILAEECAAQIKKGRENS